MARSSSPARSSPRRRWFSGVSISGTTISPISPRVQVIRTTRWPASMALTIAPPVPIVSSSGWAWTVMSVGRWGSVRGRGLGVGVGGGVGLIGHARMLARDRGSPPGSRRYHRVDGTPARRAGPAGRPDRRRLLDRPGRAVLHDAARRPRRGRHQGGAARGRRDPRAGVRRGSGPRPTGPGPPPTTSRSTATSARSGWT